MRVAEWMLAPALLVLLLAGPSTCRAMEVAPTTEGGLSYAQVSTFARLVGVPEKDVAARLAADAQLSAMVSHALEVREARRAAAKRAIAGFVILGVGDLLGAVIMLSTPVNPDGTWSDPRVTKLPRRSRAAAPPADPANPSASQAVPGDR